MIFCCCWSPPKLPYDGLTGENIDLVCYLGRILSVVCKTMQAIMSKICQLKDNYTMLFFPN